MLYNRHDTFSAEAHEIFSNITLRHQKPIKLQKTKFVCMILFDKDKNIKRVQFSSVTQSCPTLCDPMNRSTQGFPVHHHLPEFTQTCVH